MVFIFLYVSKHVTLFVIRKLQQYFFYFISTVIEHGLNIRVNYKKNKKLKKKKACLPRFTHEAPAPRSSYELVETCPCVPDRIGIWNCWCLRRGENQSTRRKTSRSKGENQKQTEPTYRVDAGSWTQATLVGGESHHCAITCSPRLCAWRLNTHYLCHALLFHCIFAGEYKCLSSLLN